MRAPPLPHQYLLARDKKSELWRSVSVCKNGLPCSLFMCRQPLPRLWVMMSNVWSILGEDTGRILLIFARMGGWGGEKEWDRQTSRSLQK